MKDYALIEKAASLGLTTQAEKFTRREISKNELKRNIADAREAQDRKQERANHPERFLRV